MSKRRRTTKAQFEAFKDAFRLWQSRFGLNEYDVEFTLDDHADAYATCSVDAKDCVCAVTFCKYVPSGCVMDTRVAQDTARHEAVHLLLGRLTHLARGRFVTEDELYHAEEKVVRVLEGLLHDV